MFSVSSAHEMPCRSVWGTVENTKSQKRSLTKNRECIWVNSLSTPRWSKQALLLIIMHYTYISSKHALHDEMVLGDVACRLRILWVYFAVHRSSLIWSWCSGIYDAGHSTRQGMHRCNEQFSALELCMTSIPRFLVLLVCKSCHLAMCRCAN